jgi:hypothetical protein
MWLHAFPIFAFLVAFMFGQATIAQVAPADRDYVEDVRAKLGERREHLSSQGYRLHTPEAIEPIHRDKANRIRLSLKAGITYAIIAACDRDCAHVQISLLDQNETHLIQSPEKEPIVIVSGTPATDGPYTAELHAPGCRMRACHAGMVVMRLDATLERAPTVAEPPAPRSEHELVSALQRELKRVGCDPGEVDGEWGPNSRDALAKFAKNANVALDVDGPSETALAAIVSRKDQVCSALIASGFDGLWTITWSGESNCRRTNGAYAIRFQEGVIVAGATSIGVAWSGSVSATGAVRWRGRNSHGPLHYSGRFVGNSGAGRFSNVDCTGTFVATRR